MSRRAQTPEQAIENWLASPERTSADLLAMIDKVKLIHRVRYPSDAPAKPARKPRKAKTEAAQ